MRNFSGIGIVAILTLSSGCGSSAVYLKGGTVCVLQQEATVIAAVPDSTGKLIPDTRLVLPVGTEFKYQGK